MHYRPEIDGLRALAVLAVVAHHAGAPLKGGFLGVDIFFVISGYLITTILLGEMAEGRFSLGAFYLRRARRLLPALFLVVTVSIPVAWAVMAPDQMKMFGQGLVALSVFASNGLFWQQAGYFAPAAAENPLIHTWSLAVEEQFYLVFPLALLWLGRRGRVVPGLATALVVGLLMAEAAARLAPAAAFYLLPFRAWELLAGCFAAALVARWGLPATGHDTARGPFGLWAVLAYWRGLCALGGLGLIGASLALYHAWLPIPGLWLVAPVGGTVLVLLCAGPGTWAHWLLSARPAVALGLISYSAYLWHQPVFAFARLAQLDPPAPGLMAGLTMLVLGLAWATWALVEMPCRRGMQLRTLIGLTGGAGLAAAMLGLVLHSGQGLGALRYGADRLALFSTAQPVADRDRCHGLPGQIAPEAACVLGAGAPGWAVLGDSHGVEIAHALATRMRLKDRGVVQLTASGCPPALGYTSDVPECAAWTEAAVTWLEARPEIAVLLAYRHNAYLFGQNDAAYPALPDTPCRIGGPGGPEILRARYWVGFSEMVARLRQGGRRVVVLAPIPEIARPVAKYVRLGQPDGAGNLPAVPYSYHAARNLWINPRLSALDIEILDPTQTLCDDVACYGARAGQALYFDDDHLSLTGAGRVLSSFTWERHQTQAVSRARAAPPIQKVSSETQNGTFTMESRSAANKAVP